MLEDIIKPNKNVNLSSQVLKHLLPNILPTSENWKTGGASPIMNLNNLLLFTISNVVKILLIANFAIPQVLAEDTQETSEHGKRHKGKGGPRLFSRRKINQTETRDTRQAFAQYDIYGDYNNDADMPKVDFPVSGSGRRFNPNFGYGPGPYGGGGGGYGMAHGPVYAGRFGLPRYQWWQRRYGQPGPYEGGPFRKDNQDWFNGYYGMYGYGRCDAPWPLRDAKVQATIPDMLTKAKQYWSLARHFFFRFFVISSRNDPRFCL